MESHYSNDKKAGSTAFDINDKDFIVGFSHMFA